MGSTAEEKQIVIIGCGIIGCCIAYYITRHPSFVPSLHSVTVLEASQIAGGSSGKAGGVVATWADPSCIAPLSHHLHTELAKEHDGESNWGYRKVHCADVDAMGEAVGHATAEQTVSHFHSHTVSEPNNADFPSELDWIIPDRILSYTELGDPTNTAQVHPYLFTHTIARLAEEQGAKIILGSVTTINYKQKGGAAESVTYKDANTSQVHELPATDIVIAAGPWTQFLFPTAPIKESRNHSIVVRPSRPISAYVLFPELHPKTPQTRIPPEIYSRPDGTIYACCPSDTDVPLPETSALVAVNEEVCNTIYKDISSISAEIRNGEILIKQACYRPIVVGRNRDIGPLVGRTGIEGLWLATGHDSWGISNGPATGKVMSEMIFEGCAQSTDVSSLDPRLMLGKSGHAKNMDQIPFTSDRQLCTTLSIDPIELVLRRSSNLNKPTFRTKKTTLPGQPRIGLDDPNIGNYLHQELETPDLNRLSPYLWLVAKQDSSHISSLSHQIIRGRQIIITENPELHLVWIHDRVYIKPIPKYLLSHAFWNFYLMSKNSPIPEPSRRDLKRAAQGFLRSYAHLIQHKSDFSLAQDAKHRLLPAKTKHCEFIRFITEFEHLSDHDVSPRYAFGELRLTRLNFWSKVFLRRFTFQKVDGQYSAYFARFYGPILFVFGIFSVALNSMQVALAVQPLIQLSDSWVVFAELARAFAICTLLCVALVVLFLVLVMLALCVRETVYAARDLYRKRMSRRKTLSKG
ncbi:hypothetical protein MMC13_001068 [Lambiella insularis]|nr:hypothetical protein [Lambiella insularis]